MEFPDGEDLNRWQEGRILFSVANDWLSLLMAAFGMAVRNMDFSIAGKQLGSDDDRDMFPTVMGLVERIKPRAVLFENVPGLASAKFENYRRLLLQRLERLGYETAWEVLQSSDFGVPQLRPRFVLVALRSNDANFFNWPPPSSRNNSVGETLGDLMGENGWIGTKSWVVKAAGIAPTLVGGSKKHGGPDLGPTRARKQWLELGVDGLGIANSAPSPSFPNDGIPRLTLRMTARIQSFPDEWSFQGGKTAAYRQIGNAFPPLFAKAIGSSISNALNHRKITTNRQQLRLLETCKPKKKYAAQKKDPNNSSLICYWLTSGRLTVVMKVCRMPLRHYQTRFGSSPKFVGQMLKIRRQCWNGSRASL